MNIDFKLLDKQRESLRRVLDQMPMSNETREDLEGINALLDALSDDHYHAQTEEL